MIIAFMGQGGTGKTTLCRILTEKLSKEGYHVIYRKEFEYFLLRYIFKTTKTASKIRTKILQEGIIPIYKIWLILLFVDNLLAYLYYKIFKRKSIVLIDRFIYDYLIGLELMGGESRFFRWLYYKFKPYLVDKIYLLDVDPKVACERERNDLSQKEHLKVMSFNQLMNLYITTRKKYLRVAKDLKLKIINTEKPIESVLNLILEDSMLSNSKNHKNNYELVTK